MYTHVDSDRDEEGPKPTRTVSWRLRSNVEGYFISKFRFRFDRLRLVVKVQRAAGKKIQQATKNITEETFHEAFSLNSTLVDIELIESSLNRQYCS